MSETTTTSEHCRWVSSIQPRMLMGRHLEDCDGEGCTGCQPCTRPHCRVCQVDHAAGACGGCLTEVRGNLAELVRMNAALPAEVVHRGVDGEAMALLVPTTDPEAYQWREAAAWSGVTAPSWMREKGEPLDPEADQRHPLWVLGTWRLVWEDALGHQTDERLTVDTAARYLDAHMSAMALDPHVPFEDFARDVRQSVGHMEAVLHDGEQVERGAPCWECPIGKQKPLTKVYGKIIAFDRWICVREPNHWHTESEYRRAVAGDYAEKADRLNAKQLIETYGIKRGSLTAWATKGLVKKRGKDHNGLTLYDVAQALVQQAETRRREHVA